MASRYIREAVNEKAIRPYDERAARKMMKRTEAPRWEPDKGAAVEAIVFAQTRTERETD